MGLFIKLDEREKLLLEEETKVHNQLNHISISRQRFLIHLLESHAAKRAKESVGSNK